MRDLCLLAGKFVKHDKEGVRLSLLGLSLEGILQGLARASPEKATFFLGQAV